DTVDATVDLAAASTGSLKANVQGDGGGEDDDEDGSGSVGGNDDLTLAVTGPIAAGAKADLQVDGGAGNDTVTVSYAGKLDGKLTLNATGGPGDDTVAATVDLAAGSTGSLNARVIGDSPQTDDHEDDDEDDGGGAGGGNDPLPLNITGATAQVTIVALLDGGPGTDTCVATANVTVINCEL